MKVGEFVKRVQRLAKKTQLPAGSSNRTGKGSHGSLYYGGGRTTVQDRKRELPTGTLHAMLRQLGIASEIFNQE